MRVRLAALLALLPALALAQSSPEFSSLQLKGSSSGVATLSALATAGTPAIKLPNTSGTVATTASSPIVLNATTGVVSCPTCGTGTGNVAGPGSSTTGHIATYGDTTGKVIADGGALATVATSGSAADLSTGTLSASRLPALTGDVTTSAGSAATTLAAGSAANLNSGTLNAARLPALTGDVTSSAGSAATTLAAGSASNLNSGTLAAARGGAGTISGALKGNGSGVVSQAACADLSNGATGCSTATGTSGATIPLLNGANTWSASQAGSVTTLSISTATFTPDASNNHYKLTLSHANCPCTLANPSPNFVAGTSGTIEVIQSSSGSDTIGTWGSSYVAPGGTASIALSSGANAIDVLAYFVIDSTHIALIPTLNYSH